MSAIRLPLLCAFAGGCLSNAILFALWRTGDGAGAVASTQQRSSRQVGELVTAAAAASGAQPTSALVAAAHVAEPGRAAAEPAPIQAARDLDGAGPTPAGSSVSDVLMRLEAAYRERVSARAPAQASSTEERATPAGHAAAEVESARILSAQPIAEVTPAVPPPTATAAAIEPRAVAAATPAAVTPAAVALAAPAAVMPAAVAIQAPAVASQAAAAPAFAAQEVPPPSQIHYGDNNQNTYVTNVRQGDVYLVQMQQIAVLQYMQLLGLSSGLAAPARHVGGAGHQRGALSSGITNPDNPWGFRFAPPNLVR